MKENIKKYCFGISFLYVISITLLVIVNFLSVPKTIYLKDSEDNLEKFNKLKNEVNTLKESECKTIINDFIKYYEKTSYDDNVLIRDIYDIAMNESPISYYMKFTEKCDITDEEVRHKLANNAVSSSLQLDRIFVKDYFKYEITLKDEFNRMIIEPSFYNQEYIISKYEQLEIIEILIDSIKGGKVNE